MLSHRSFLWLSILFSLTSLPSARAGDCETHPFTLIDLDVVSCKPLDASNARHVVRVEQYRPVEKAYIDAQVAKVVADGPMLIRANVHRTRTIVVDSQTRVIDEPEAEDWKSDVRSRWLLLRTKDSNACTQVTSKKRTVLAHFTDCSCDTGPTGWCVVDGEAIVDSVPEDLVKFPR